MPNSASPPPTSLLSHQATYNSKSKTCVHQSEKITVLHDLVEWYQAKTYSYLFINFVINLLNHNYNLAAVKPLFCQLVGSGGKLELNTAPTTALNHKSLSLCMVSHHCLEVARVAQVR